MAKGKGSRTKKALEEKLVRAQKALARERAKREATEKLIAAGWRPKE